MPTSIKFFVLPLLITCLYVNDLFAGAWTKKKNEGYSQLSYTYIYSNSLFKSDGSTTFLRRSVGDYTLQTYLEYGLSERLTLISILPYKMVSTSDDIFDTKQFTDTLPSGNLNGFSNITLGGRYRFINKKHVLSIQFKVIGNTFSTDRNAGLRTGYNTWVFNPSILIGRSFKKGYHTAEVGVQVRSNDYSNLFHANYELGYSRKGKTWFVVVLDVLRSMYDGNIDDGTSLHTGLYVNDQEGISYGGKVLHYINKNWGVNLSGFGSFSANQVAHFPAVTIGISYEWGK